MARGMNASVSLARAMLILSSCLVFGTLIGLLPRNSGGQQNLRSTSAQLPQQQQHQETPAGGSRNFRPHLPDMSLFSRAAFHKEEENRPLHGGDFMWNGGLATIPDQALDAVDTTDYSFSFEFEYSYDYYY